VECKLRCVNFRRVSNPRRAFLPAFRVTRSADDKRGNTWEHWRQTWEHWQQPWEHQEQTWEHRQQSLEHRQHTWEHRRQAWEHLKSQQSSLGKTASSLGTLLERLEIIATTYCSTIFKTHVFSLYSVCILINVSMYLYNYQSTHGISGLAAAGAWEQFGGGLETTFEWIQRYTPRPWLSEFGDVVRERDWVNWKMHWEAVIERVWRCTWRPMLSELRDAHGGCHQVNLQMHWEAVIERVWKYPWSLWSSKFGDAIEDQDPVNSKIHSEAMIRWVWKFSCSRLWSSEIEEVLGGGRSGGGWSGGGRSRGSRCGDGQSAGSQWVARQVLRLYASVRSLETVGMWWGDYTCEAPMKNWLVAVDR